MFSSTIHFLVNSADFSSRMLVPNMVKDFGGSNFAVGLVVGVYGAMSFLSYYLFGRAADMYGRRMMLRIGLLLSALAFLLQTAANSTETLFLARALTGFCYGIAPAALIAYVYESGKSIGKFSSYGSLGWFAGALSAGVIASYHEIFIASSGFLVIAFFLSLRMPSAGTRRIQVPLFPRELIRKNFGIYFPYLLRHLGASITWTIIPLYLVSIGASFFWVGVVHAVNVGTQFLVMRRLEAQDNRKLMLWGFILSSFVFYAYTLADDFAHILPVQVVLGFAWAFLYVGSLRSLLDANIERATASGLLNSTINLAGIIGPLIAGVIMLLASYHAVMYFSSFLCITALAYYVVFNRRNLNRCAEYT